MPLPSTGFLADTSSEMRDMLEALATEVTLERGEALFSQGDAGDALFALVNGRLEVSVLSSQGRKLVLDVMRPGALLGEIALFDPGERTATVTAIDPSVLLRLTHADLTTAVANTPELATDLMRLAGRRMRWMSAQLGDQVFLPLSTRLARRLLYLSTGSGPGPVEIEIGQAQLAEFVGATREAVSKALGEWKRAGVVDPARGGLAILNFDALERLARQDEV